MQCMINICRTRLRSWWVSELWREIPVTSGHRPAIHSVRVKMHRP